MQTPMIRLMTAAALMLSLTACSPQQEQAAESDAGARQSESATQNTQANSGTQSAKMQTVSVTDAKAMPAAHADLVTLDVRTPEEFGSGHLAGAQNIDFKGADFAKSIANLDKSKPYLVYCHSGRRSAAASEQMAAAGFTKIYNLDGGIQAWQAAGQPVKQ